MARKSLFAVLLAAIAAVSQASFASTLYDESIDGDLVSGSQGPTTIRTLVSGENVIRGHWSWPVGPGTFDDDSLKLVVPTGFNVTSLTAQIINVGGGISGLTEVGFFFQGNSLPSFLGNGVIAFGPDAQPAIDWYPVGWSMPEPVNPWTFPYGAGNYEFGIKAGGKLTVDSPQFDYAWTFNVSPVPIPPAVWLFGSALGAMGWMRRKVAS